MTDKYQQFYDEHKHRLFSYLLYKSGDHETSLEIMQESFTRHFAKYRDKALTSPALLFTIARNALIDYQRPRQQTTVVSDLTVAVTADAETTAQSRQECQRILTAVNSLPEEEREILSLAVGGLPYREIGAILGTTEANIKVKVHRARTKLRQTLRDGEAS